MISLITLAFGALAGGAIIVAVERRTWHFTVETIEATGWRQAFWVGVSQVLSLLPGVSRAGATIIGAMLMGLSRQAATEFSFYLAMPTLIGAGVYSLYKERANLALTDLPMFAVGFVVSFIAAWVCVRWFLRYIASHSFVPFAWYRIAFGAVILATAYSGVVRWE